MARYNKHWGHAWFVLHVIINSVAALATLVGFLFAIVRVNHGHGRHFGGAYAIHKLSGLLVLFMTLVQVGLGIRANHLYNPRRRVVPCEPDQVHWWLGRATVFLALANVYSGLEAASAAQWVKAMCVLIGTGVGGYAVWKERSWYAASGGGASDGHGGHGHPRVVTLPS